MTTDSPASEPPDRLGHETALLMDEFLRPCLHVPALPCRVCIAERVRAALERVVRDTARAVVEHRDHIDIAVYHDHEEGACCIAAAILRHWGL